MELTRTINSDKRYYLDEKNIENAASFLETMRVFNDAKMYLYNALYDQKYLNAGPLLDHAYPVFLKEKYKTKSVVYALIASLFIALGNTVKGSIAVMLISVMIFFVLKMGVKRGAILSLAAVMLLIGVSKAAYYGGLAMGISDEKMVDRYRFPVTHWIMMSLNSEYKTHVDEDVDFTMSFDTYDSKKQANIRNALRVLYEHINESHARKRF